MKESKLMLDEHIDDIRHKVEVEGMGFRKIADIYGCSNSTVADFCRKREIKPLDRKLRLGGKGRTSPVHMRYTDEEVSREEILDAENKELKKIISKQRSGSVDSARAVEAIITAVDSITFTPNKFKTKVQKTAGAKPHHRQLVALSDFHGGENVDPDVVNNLNNYSWQIMEDRVQETIDSILSHRAKSPGLTGLDIAFVGDMCSGANHDEITITNEFPLAEQAVRIGQTMAHIVETLLPFYENINVVSVEGNHPRLTKAPAAKMPHNNGDWIASQFAKQYLAKCENVDFRIGRGSIIHEIAGRKIFVWHGDGIRSSMPGVPWGGVMRRTNQIQASHPTQIDHFLFGHFHQANFVQAGRVIGNGSLKGCDEWVLKNFGGGDPPAQFLLTFDENKSRITDVRLITPTAGIPNL